MLANSPYTNKNEDEPGKRTYTDSTKEQTLWEKIYSGSRWLGLSSLPWPCVATVKVTARMSQIEDPGLFGVAAYCLEVSRARYGGRAQAYEELVRLHDALESLHACLWSTVDHLIGTFCQAEIVKRYSK